MRILFLARRYPPCVGGIETCCYQLYTRLSPRISMRLVALRRQSLLHLAWFLPWCLWVGFWALLLRRVDTVYFSDGVVSALAPLLRPFSRARFVLTLYGLELTYRNPVARWLMRRGAHTCDRVAVISQHTRDLALQAGVPEAKVALIYVGVEPMMLPEERCRELRERFAREHGVELGRERVLLNYGRLVRRKGVAAFLEKGMPLLEPDIRLIIGGRGPEAQRLLQVRQDQGLEGRVLFLGPLEDETAAMLRQSADLFLMPNVPTPGDVEGFGMTHLESMYAGLPVVAFAVDALVESTRRGGYLIPAGQYQAFADQIHAYYALSAEERQAKKEEARAYVRAEYSWEQTARQYLDLFTGRN